MPIFGHQPGALFFVRRFEKIASWRRHPSNGAAGRRQQRERWAKATPEERAAKRLRDNEARRIRRAKPTSPHRAVEAARQRRRRASLTPEQRAAELERARDYEARRKPRSPEQRDRWNAIRRERRRKTKVSALAALTLPAPVMAKEADRTQRLRRSGARWPSRIGHR